MRLIRRLAVLLSTALLLAGCVSGYRYVPTSPNARYGPDLVKLFEFDLKACGGSTKTETFVSPVIVAPIIVTAVMVQREQVRQCMEKRGWRVVEDRPPGEPTEPLDQGPGGGRER